MISGQQNKHFMLGASDQSASRRGKQVRWENLDAEIKSALVTKGSKLRSAKRFIIMDPGSKQQKVSIEVGDTKVETYINDVELTTSSGMGANHIREVKRGNLSFTVKDTSKTEKQDTDSGGKTETFTFEFERELSYKPVTTGSIVEEMANLSTSATPTPSSEGRNRGFATSGDEEERMSTSGASSGSFQRSCSKLTTSSPKPPGGFGGNTA